MTENTNMTYIKHKDDANEKEKEVFDLIDAFADIITKYIYKKNNSMVITREIFDVIRTAVVNHAGSALSGLKEVIPKEDHEEFINEHCKIIKMKFEMGRNEETMQ